MKKTEVIIIGSGNMAVEYSKVLKKLKKKHTAICRSKESAVRFFENTGIICDYNNGLEDYLVHKMSKNNKPKFAIVAVPVEDLFEIGLKLVNAGIKNILLEKPGALFQEQLVKLNEVAVEKQAKIYVAYNRRFFQSVRHLKKMAQDDGGIVSLYFDFTEWSDKIKPLKKGICVKERWVLSNSSHVIDLAFFLAGKPKDMKCFHTGYIGWHSGFSKFSGAGVTDKDIIFSYRADWDSSGRWGLMAYTKNFCFQLVPMENLHIVERNSVVKEEIILNSDIDLEFKPGLYHQIKAFISENDQDICLLKDHIQNFKFYEQIAGYKEHNLHVV
jgi:predicted dehydrogenase